MPDLFPQLALCTRVVPPASVTCLSPNCVTKEADTRMLRTAEESVSRSTSFVVSSFFVSFAPRFFLSSQQAHRTIPQNVCVPAGVDELVGVSPWCQPDTRGVQVRMV